MQRKLPLPGEEDLQKEDRKSSQDLQTIGTRTPEDSSDQRSRSESQSCARGVRDRISLGTIIVDARVRARSSIFVTSGVNILEGDLPSLLIHNLFSIYCPPSDKREATHEFVVAKGVQFSNGKKVWIVK